MSVVGWTRLFGAGFCDDWEASLMERWSVLSVTDCSMSSSSGWMGGRLL